MYVFLYENMYVYALEHTGNILKSQVYSSVVWLSGEVQPVAEKMRLEMVIGMTISKSSMVITGLF